MTKKTTKAEVVVAEEQPAWETLEDMIDYFRTGINLAMLTLTRIMWEAGQAGEHLQNESKYGDGAMDQFAKGISKTTSWVYECIKMKQAYTWDEIQEKFLKNGIPASSVARLGCIKDDGARAFVEDKLVSGEISYEEISKAKKEYETVQTNSDIAHNEIGDGAEPSIEEQNASKNAGDDSPDSQAHASIRTEIGKSTKMVQALCLRLKSDSTSPYNSIDRLGEISDQSLYALSQDRVFEFGTECSILAITLVNVLGSIRKLDPAAIVGLEELVELVNNELGKELK